MNSLQRAIKAATAQLKAERGDKQNGAWKAGWREIGGKRKYFRSKWEANYARYLEWLKVLRKISEWEHEPETFWFEGLKRGTVSYLPDFRVTLPSGKLEYHEVKGYMDPKSATKIKRMAKYHPTIVLRVVGAKAYRQLSMAVGRLVPGWE